MSEQRYDAVIVGSGQGGGPMAMALAREGWKVALIEQEHVGGTCVNEGCTPSKTMVASARVAHSARRAADYGLRAGEVEVKMPEVVARKNAVVTMFRDGSTAGIESAGVELISGRARFRAPRRLDVSLEGGGSRTVEGERVFLNTGARPVFPAVRGLDSVPSLNSTTIMELEEVPEHLLVIGGGYIALEFGQMFRRFGSRVTIVQRGPQLLSREDGDVARGVQDILEGEGVDVRLDTEVRSVSRGDSGELRAELERVGGAERRSSADATPSGATIRGSHLLVAAGRRPNTDDLGLEAAGVETDERGFVVVGEGLETTAPGVFALGDIKAGPAFTHISFDDFRIARENVLGTGNASLRNRLVPYVVFIDPQLGRVGLSEKEAKHLGVAYRVARMPAERAARAIEMGETRGFWKVLVSPDSGAILGAAILSAEGGEIMAMLQIAMKGELPYWALRDGVFAHPTFAESLNNAFASFDE